MIFSPLTRIRILAPAHRAKADAHVSEAQPGDTIQLLDRPIRRVDPVTRQATDELQSFVVGEKGTLALE